MGTGRITMDNMNFYLINIINSFKSKKYRIGFAISGLPLSYNRIMASTRIRVYDVIKMFWKDKYYLVELYNAFRKYGVVVFQKKFDKVALLFAKKLKSKGVKVVLDINVNYYDSSSRFISKAQNKNVIEFTKIADKIITPSKFIDDYIKQVLPAKEVAVIEESIDDMYFARKKKNFNKKLNLIWSGYSTKASEILLIGDILEELNKKVRFNLIFICEKNPNIKIGGIPIYFVRYNYFKIVKQLLKGDIFIAPRDLGESYNLGHAFTKIGLAMAVGLPVIASPVPSYLNSPAILCLGKKEWKENLEKMLKNVAFLRYLSDKGRKFAKENYSSQAIKAKYVMLFNELLK